MPTPDPSVLPAAITTTATLFTSNYSTFVGAAIAIIAIIVLPALVIRGGLRVALHGLGRIFRVAR